MSEEREVTHLNNINLEFRNELIDAYNNQEDIKEYNQMMDNSMAFCKTDAEVYYKTADGKEFTSEEELAEYLESEIYKTYLKEYGCSTIGEELKSDD